MNTLPLRLSPLWRWSGVGGAPAGPFAAAAAAADTPNIETSLSKHSILVSDGSTRSYKRRGVWLKIPADVIRRGTAHLAERKKKKKTPRESVGGAHLRAWRRPRVRLKMFGRSILLCKRTQLCGGMTRWIGGLLIMLAFSPAFISLEKKKKRH